MQLLDGKKLAGKIFEELKIEVAPLGRLRLAVVKIGENPSVNQFISIKKKKAESVGIDVRIYPFEETITTNVLRDRMNDIVHEEENTCVIVQLPLPEHINTQSILNAVTPEKDADVLSARAVGDFAVGKEVVVPPVAGAVKMFFEEYAIDFKRKHIVVMGAGVLVGRPVIMWLLQNGGTFSLIRSDTESPEKIMQHADIIISGVGKPRFITGEMVKDGVVVIDAGTSESNGEIVGDIDFDSVAPKAAHVTPVPGGVGPVTVAMLFKNVVVLAKKQKG